MMCSYVEKLEERFVTEGGIKERMHAARTGYRQHQDEHMLRLEEENRQLRAENEKLKKMLAELNKI
jgi:regulator of replication initiation timing